MDTLQQIGNGEKRGVNKVLLVGILIGTLLVAGAIGWILSLKPSSEEQTQRLFAGAFLEGSPEFEKYTKDIVIQSDMDNIMQSPTAMGTIMMTINGRIRNKGRETISGLEVKVGVVDMSGKVVREKKLMVVPKQHEKLAPGETIPVVGTIEGFRKDDDRANVRWKVTAIRIE